MSGMWAAGSVWRWIGWSEAFLDRRVWGADVQEEGVARDEDEAHGERM